MIVISRAEAAAEDDLLVPVGFRFHPTDEELVTHYLKKKLKGMDSHVSNIIREIDILKFEPWDLPERSPLKSDDENWFFFSQPEYNKHKKNRTTREGFWKITGREHAIKARDNRSVIGRKRILTFYKGRVRNSKRTNWVMHEYYIPDDNPNAQRDFVLCRVKKNPDKKDTSVFAEGEPSSYKSSNCEDQAAADVTPESQNHSPSTLQSPACIEQGVVLQSPFGDNDDYSVTNKNAISTSDFENEVTQQSPTYRNLEDLMYIDDSDIGNQTSNNMVLEQPCTQPVENLYPLFPPPAQDYNSYILQSPIYTEPGSVPHVDVYENQWQSTYDDDKQVSNSNANFENRTTDGRISEEFPQPKENLRSILYASQLEDYTSQPLMNTEECQMRPCEIGIEGAAGMNWEGSFFHFPLKP